MTFIALIALGLVAGAIAASLGIGGGIIFVPALVTLFGFVQQEAQGTSLAIIVPTALVGTLAHARAGRVDWRAGAIVAVGAALGALGGSRLALSLDETLLKRLFAVFLVLIAVRMLLRTTRLSANRR